MAVGVTETLSVVVIRDPPRFALTKFPSRNGTVSGVGIEPWSASPPSDPYGGLRDQYPEDACSMPTMRPASAENVPEGMVQGLP